MNFTRTSFLVVILSASACAQVSNPVQTINTVRNQLIPATNAINDRRDKTVQQAANTPAPTARPAARTTAGVPQAEIRRGKRPAKPGAEESTAAEDNKGTVENSTIQVRNKRDPFVSIIKAQTATSVGCSTGKKCLVVGDVMLKGIVRSSAGMIAVVENGQRKTYFLHENDPVFNGQVVKIEPDAIVFREMVVDRLGRQSSREIVKRILKPAIS
jgi:hypothetical protein